MRVRLPDTPTLREVAGEVMRTVRKLPPEHVPTEWRIARERYLRVVDEMNTYRKAIGKPVVAVENGGLAVCGIPLFPDMSTL